MLADRICISNGTCRWTTTITMTSPQTPLPPYSEMPYCAEATVVECDVGEELNEPRRVFRALVDRLSHLNLTDRIEQRTGDQVAHGGFCDVFVGKSHAHGGITVAIKRLRVHVLTDAEAAKVTITSTKGSSCVY